MVICHAQKSYQIVTINDHFCPCLYIQMCYLLLIEERTGLQETDQKMSASKTSVIKISEFAEIANFIGINGVENSASLIALIESQTQAKQNKFWKYFDRRMTVCHTCAKKILKSHAPASNGNHSFCSDECCQINLKKFNYAGQKAGA